jgi:TatA/E family protein of Tat protein translocase
MFGGIGGSEVLLIVLLVLVLFGSRRMPELARGLGKLMHEARKAVDEIKREIEKPVTPDLPDLPKLPKPEDKTSRPAG